MPGVPCLWKKRRGALSDVQAMPARFHGKITLRRSTHGAARRAGRVNLLDLPATNMEAAISSGPAALRGIDLAVMRGAGQPANRVSRPGDIKRANHGNRGSAAPDAATVSETRGLSAAGLDACHQPASRPRVRASQNPLFASCKCARVMGVPPVNYPGASASGAFLGGL
jgi:hypothetical protein